jgi:hypothetical protein
MFWIVIRAVFKEEHTLSKLLPVLLQVVIDFDEIHGGGLMQYRQTLPILRISDLHNSLKRQTVFV